MNPRIKPTLRLLFILYGLLMLWLLFGQRLNADIPGTYWERFRDNVNLTPFLTINEFMNTATITTNPYLVRHSFINLVGNVVMFVPLGFFPPHFWDKLQHFTHCMLWSMGCIVTIELVQLFTLLGSCDVDDLILNMVGVAIGYALYRLLYPLLKCTDRKTN